MIGNEDFWGRFDKNILGKFSYLPSAIPSMEVIQTNHLLRVNSNLPCDMFNILCCNGATDVASISENITYFRSKSLPYAFWVGFENEPSWLESELQKLGLITDETEWAMVRDLATYQEEIERAHFQVKKICNQRGIEDVIHVMRGIFPKQEHDAISSFYQQSTKHVFSLDARLVFFVGYENENPVSLVSLYFEEGLVSLFDVIVLPEMRGRGLGKLMMQKALLEAKAKGFNRCILTATNDAKYLYQKLGFVVVKTMKVYHD